MADDQVDTATSQDIRTTGAFIITGLSGGHGVFHWYTQSFLVMLPYIKETLLLSPIQVGSLLAIRQFVGGMVTLPAGILADMFRRQWGVMMGGCFVLIAIAYLLLSLAPNYPLLAAGMVLVAIPPAIWHLPATAALSRRFAQRRGMALAVHGVGGNVGDVVGPVVTGLLLATLLWRYVFRIYAAPALLVSLAAVWAFRSLGTYGVVEQSRASGQVRKTVGLLRSPALLLLMTVLGLRTMAQTAFFAFFTVYLSEELGMSAPQVGFHVGLLTFMGIFSSPALGFLSDRLGRKTVLAPGLLSLGIMTGLLVNVDAAWGVTVIVGMIGLFLYSLQAVILAGAMDTVREGIEASALGLFFFSRSLMAAASPLIAGAIYERLGSHEAFYYVAALFLAAAMLVVLLPFHRAPAERA